jgi:hypothetical protein
VPFIFLLKVVHNIPRFTLDLDSFIGGGSQSVLKRIAAFVEKFKGVGGEI